MLYSRLSDPRAFYIPAQNRKNLTVTVDALVSRVVTEQASGKAKATAVEFLHGDKTHTVKVGREVILSAGYVVLTVAAQAGPD